MNVDRYDLTGHVRVIVFSLYLNSSVLIGGMELHYVTAVCICQGLVFDVGGLELLPQLNEFDFYALVQAYLSGHPELNLQIKQMQKLILNY